LKHFQKRLFLDQVYGNVLETDDEDCFTGKVEDPIVDAAYKQKLVQRMRENYRAERSETIVVGDGANDLLMMTEAGISVSFCGKPKLTAAVNTWILDRNLFWIKGLL
jgi:phosphoserine phosphatase